MSESLLSWPDCFCHQESVKLLTSRVNRDMITEKKTFWLTWAGRNRNHKAGKASSACDDHGGQ